MEKVSLCFVELEDKNASVEITCSILITSRFELDLFYL